MKKDNLIWVHSEPSAPSSLRSEPAPLPGEPILYEKDGWGIFTPAKDSSFWQPKDKMGSVLTHIGCACEYPNWAFAQILWSEQESYREGFVCRDCKAVLQVDDYQKLVLVYCFINGIKR